jgi:hypothetical protein
MNDRHYLLEAFLVVDSHSCFRMTVASNGNKGPGEAGPAQRTHIYHYYRRGLVPQAIVFI